MFLKNSVTYLARGSLWLYRIATIAVVVIGLCFLALVIGLRYLVLPHIDEYREQITQAMTRAVGQRVTIGSISGSWRGYWPEMSFMDVKVLDAQGQPALALDRVTGVLSWQSIPAAEWRFDSLAVDAPSLQIRRAADGVIWIAGIGIKPGDGGGGFGDWVLAQRQILIRDAAIVWLDEMRAAPALTLDKVNFRLERESGIHRFGLTAVPPSQVASPLVARGEFAGSDMRALQEWNGKLYAEIEHANLALAQEWISAPFELTSGVGSMRLWLELEGTRVGSATADVRLVDVKTRLAADLPELSLSAIQGRLGWIQRENRTEFSGASLGFSIADGPQLAPMRFSFAYLTPAGGVRSSLLRLADFDLGFAAYLANFLPLDPALRARLDRIEPAGTVQDAVVSWDGAWGTGPYAVKGQVAGLSVRPDSALPGLHGASAQVDANERGGTLSLNVTKGGVDLPAVFLEPLPLDFLTANAKWTVRQGVVEIAVRNASFTNEHLAGTVSGSYSTAGGRGIADVSGTLVRADAQQVWRYVPRTLTATQAWLKRALLAGEASDTRFRIKGPLKDFPFADDKNGIFEVKTRASGVLLDFAEGWPPLNGLRGEVSFRGRRMEVRAQAGEAFGLRLADARASIAELGSQDQHVVVKGSASGPTSGFVRYVSAMPNVGVINGVTSGFKAAGDARLDLELDLPLQRIKDTAVKGELRLQNNQVTLDPRLPPLERFGARIAFSEKGFNVTDGRAVLFGAPLSFEAANQGDGGIAANLAGTLDVDQARTLWNHPVLGFVDGRTPWRATIGVRNKLASVRVESTLVGLRSSLPPPFTKAAAVSLPVRVELREQAAAAQSLLAVDLGKVASALLLLERDAPGGLRRGTISLGTPAALPLADGLWVKGSLGVVDADVWQRVLSDGSSDAPPLLAGVDLQVGILDLNRRRFHDLKVEATRYESEWRATLAGNEVAGLLSWASAGGGKLTARFSKFILPPIMTEVQPGTPATGDASLPSVDLIAESFTYEGKDLGRLTVLAQPDFSGWELRRLELVNPESKFVMDGHWAIGADSRTEGTVKLDVSDVGKFFARLGWPKAVKGGSATLEGPIQWRGNPTRFDIPSLSGQLKLEAKDGRFQEIEPGVAKLLGILSLQALPRRVTLDFRDVFSKGFSFDHISANVSITSGLADTRNFLMQGSAARVAMRGQVDLARETQNLVVRVTPSLSEGIAIAGAIVNPAIGVAALIAQKALKDPFSQFASFDYSVTGTWAEPVIARISKAPPKEKATGR